MVSIRSESHYYITQEPHLLSWSHYAAHGNNCVFDHQPLHVTRQNRRLWGEPERRTSRCSSSGCSVTTAERLLSDFCSSQNTTPLSLRDLIIDQLTVNTFNIFLYFYFWTWLHLISDTVTVTFTFSKVIFQHNILTYEFCVLFITLVFHSPH